MRTALAIVLGLTLTGASAMAGPSTHELGRAEWSGRADEGRNRVEQPYRLTGEQRNIERKIVWRDVPTGRGQTQSLPFLVPVVE
jgi:hypothetical protein